MPRRTDHKRMRVDRSRRSDTPGSGRLRPAEIHRELKHSAFEKGDELNGHAHAIRQMKAYSGFKGRERREKQIAEHRKAIGEILCMGILKSVVGERLTLSQLRKRFSKQEQNRANELTEKLVDAFLEGKSASEIESEVREILSRHAEQI